MKGWHLDLGAGERLPVALRFSRRRTVALHLRPGPVLELRAPHGCPRDVLTRFLETRRDWVRRHLATLPPPPPRWVYSAGEAHPFLGGQLRLEPVAATRRRVTREGGRLRVELPSPSREDHVAALVRGWYTAQVRRVGAWRLRAWRRRLDSWRLPATTLRVRRMRRRWGSCSSSGVITLNTRLVERSIALIDFVVVHELCHLLEFRHSRRFYALMDEALPDWRRRAEALDRGGLHE